nr:MAG TPA: hypothetical protein [Caudoviricetes sp.]
MPDCIFKQRNEFHCTTNARKKFVVIFPNSHVVTSKSCLFIVVFSYIFGIAFTSVVIHTNCTRVPTVLLSARTYNTAPTGLKASVIGTAVAVKIVGEAKAFILKSSIHGVFSSLFIVSLVNNHNREFFTFKHITDGSHRTPRRCFNVRRNPIAFLDFISNDSVKIIGNIGFVDGFKNASRAILKCNNHFSVQLNPSKTLVCLFLTFECWRVLESDVIHRLTGNLISECADEQASCKSIFLEPFVNHSLGQRSEEHIEIRFMMVHFLSRITCCFEFFHQCHKYLTS